MNITIRRAVAKDAPCIVEAEREIAQTPGYFCSQPDEMDEQAVKHTILSPQNVYLVAEQEGQIVAHAFLEPYTLQSLRHIADLNIAVHLGWQGKGIGEKLLEQIIKLARSSSVIEKIQLNVRASNIAAISLYKKMGFQEEGRLKNRVKLKERYIDDIVMGLDLKRNKEIENFLIRSMKDNDIAKIVSHYSFPWSTPEKTQQMWETYYHEQQKGIRTVAVIEKDHEILGYGSLLRKSQCCYLATANIPEINAIWIDEDYRKQGLGTALIKWIENLAIQGGYSRIGIGVGLYRDYGPAQQLYFQLGYIPEGSGITYKGQPSVAGQSYPLDDELLLWLTKALL
ncbi:MAG TPA: GNAT family N-acetyltransferase [Rhabdochlamydiaceae bacterium]|jgi:ribosomal protein S18 acetylase RimI-like enzyme